MCRFFNTNFTDKKVLERKETKRDCTSERIITLFLFIFQVSREEWFQLWEEYAKNPSNPSEWQEAYMSVTFQLFDASGKFVMLSVCQKAWGK